MHYQKLEKWLVQTGTNECILRRVLLDSSSTTIQRRQVLELLQATNTFIEGMLMTVELLDSKERAEYYRQFYAQARSHRGVMKKAVEQN